MVIERECWVEVHDARLSGTLCSPDEGGAHAVMIMIHGTGPLDRNENMPGQRLDVFNTIAQRLAQDGVASLRYDKRGCGKSSGDYLRAGQSELLGDAVAWIDRMTADGFRAVYLLGHSEGTVIAARASVRRPGVAGLILLCPPLTQMETVLMNQATHIEREIETMPGARGVVSRLAVRALGRPSDNQRRVIERLKTTTTPTLRVGLQRVAAQSLRDLLALDLRDVYANVRCPMLVVGGEKDVQCDPRDAGAIATLNPRAEARIIPDLTHILRCDERAGSMFGYAELLRRPVEPQVLELIAEWLEARD